MTTVRIRRRPIESRVRYYQIGVWSKNRAEWHSWTDAPDYTSRAAAEADLACADAEMRVNAEVREMPEWWRP